jgi:calcium-dependent protein kinase
VKLYEFFSDPKYFYLVTEYFNAVILIRLVDGGELFDEIQRRKVFSEEDAADLIRQILSAIVYCHERKIVHRDLKPENILIDSISDHRISIKIIDFGTADAFSPDSKMKQTMGTPYYIAPEVLLKSYNEKCDVWSCGVILYILLSGFPPFNGRTDEEIMLAVKKTKFHYQRTFIRARTDRPNLGGHQPRGQGPHKQHAEIPP